MSGRSPAALHPHVQWLHFLLHCKCYGRVSLVTFLAGKKSFKFLFTPYYYLGVGFCAVTDLEDKEDILGSPQSLVVPVSVSPSVRSPSWVSPYCCTKVAIRPSWLQLFWDLERQGLQLQVSAWSPKDLCGRGWCSTVQKHLPLCQPALSAHWPEKGWESILRGWPPSLPSPGQFSLYVQNGADAHTP